MASFVNDFDVRVFLEENIVYVENRLLCACAAVKRVDLGLAFSIALLGMIIFMAPNAAQPEPNFAKSDLPPGSARFSLNRGNSAQSLVFSPDGKLLVAGDTRGKIHVWDWKAGRLIKELSDHDQSVLAVAFDATGTRLASGDFDGKIVVHELPSFRRLAVLDGKDSVSSLVFAFNGLLISASGLGNSAIRTWNLTTLHPLRTFAIDDKIFGFDQVVLNSANAVIALEARGKIDQLDLSDLTLIRQQLCATTSIIASAVASRSNALATVDRGGLITVWNTVTLAPNSEIRPGPRLIHHLALSPDASSLAFGFEGDTIKDDGVLMLCNIKTHHVRRMKLSDAGINAIVFAHDGQSVAVGLDSSEIFVLSVDFGD